MSGDAWTPAQQLLAPVLAALEAGSGWSSEVRRLSDQLGNQAEALKLAQAALEDANADRDQWRLALFESLKLNEQISDDPTVIQIARGRDGGWIAYHNEYPEEGSIKLSEGTDSPASRPLDRSPPSSGETSAPEEVLADPQEAPPRRRVLVAADEGEPTPRAEQQVPEAATEPSEQDRDDVTEVRGSRAGDESSEGAPPAPEAVATSFPCRCGKFEVASARGFILDFDRQKHTPKECPPAEATATNKGRWGHNANGSAWHLWREPITTSLVDGVVTQAAPCGEVVEGELVFSEKPVADAACLDCAAIDGWTEPEEIVAADREERLDNFRQEHGIEGADSAPLKCDAEPCKEPGVYDPKTKANFCEKLHLPLALGFRRELVQLFRKDLVPPKDETAARMKRTSKKMKENVRKGAKAESSGG